MVEITTAPYDQDGVPLVAATMVVSIDEELSSETPVVTAEAVQVSPVSTISTANINGAPPLPEMNSRTRRVSDEYSSSMHHQSATAEHHPTPEQPQNQVTPSVVVIDEEEEATIVSGLETHDSQRCTMGAGAAGAVFGLFLGGPIMSIVLGLGTAYYSKQEGAAGDVARALGDVALVASDKWRQVNSKHHLVERGQTMAQEAFNHVQLSEQRRRRKERVSFMLRRWVRYCWRSTCQFVEQHRLVERGCNQVNVWAEKWAQHHCDNYENRHINRWEGDWTRRHHPCRHHHFQHSSRSNHLHSH